MANPILTATLLRTLKGSPLSVLMALALVRQPVEAQWLERTTGYSDKSVSNALLFLEENGWAIRNGRYGWIMAGESVQLPLMVPEIESQSAADEAEEPAEIGEELSEKRFHGNEQTFYTGEETGESISDKGDSEKFRLGNSPSPDSSSSSRSILLDSSKDLLLARKGESEKFRVDVLEELDRWGIREPVRSRIAKKPDIAVESIRYHCSTSETSGQAIYRIEHDWKIKAAPPGLRLPETVSVETVEEEPGDEIAEGWWQSVMAGLREMMPRAQFETWVQPAGRAWQEGEALVILAVNDGLKRCIEKFTDPEALNLLVEQVSGGVVRRLDIVIPE
jgi:hypothetical protein